MATFTIHLHSKDKMDDHQTNHSQSKPMQKTESKATECRCKVNVQIRKL